MAKVNVNDLTITSLETIQAFDVVTGAFLFTLDELQSATIANSEETNDITGKAGRILSRMKRNKSVTISGDSGLVSGGLLEVQTGGKFENKTTEVAWMDYLTVAGTDDAPTATTEFKAIGTTGAEITSIEMNVNGVAKAKDFTQAATAAAGKFAYDPSTKVINFSKGDVKVGDEIIVYYKRKILADVLDNVSDNYSSKAKLYIDFLAEDKCANVYRGQFYVPKADFNGEFSIELGGDQVVHSFEAISLASGCGSEGGKALLWKYVVFGVDTADAQ